MTCRYVIHKGESFLIPECWPVVLSGDKKDCTCNVGKDRKDRLEALEIKVQKLEKIILELKQLK